MITYACNHTEPSTEHRIYSALKCPKCSANEQDFQVGEILILKSPYVDFESKVNYRGWMRSPDGRKLACVVPASGLQMMVNIDWLRREKL